MRTFWGAGLLCCPPTPTRTEEVPLQKQQRASVSGHTAMARGGRRVRGPRAPLSPAMPRTKLEDPRLSECGERTRHRQPTRGLAGGTEPQTSSSGAGPALSRSRPREQSKRGAETAMSPDVVLFGCWGNTHARGLCLAAGKFIKDTLRLRAPRPLLSAPPPEARGTDPSPSPVAKDRCLGLLR